MIPLTKDMLRLFTDTFYMAFVIWREARGETIEARTGVGFTLVNRAARGGWWGRSIDEIATKKWQYSSLTDPKDRQLVTWPAVKEQSWFEAVDIARQILGAEVTNPVPGADSYFDISIPPPKWTETARFCGQIGRLKFYDVDHDYEAGALVAAAPDGQSDFDKALRAFLS